MCASRLASSARLQPALRALIAPTKSLLELNRDGNRNLDFSALEHGRCRHPLPLVRDFETQIPARNVEPRPGTQVPSTLKPPRPVPEPLLTRSEERRVGKECRSRRCPAH